MKWSDKQRYSRERDALEAALSDGEITEEKYRSEIYRIAEAILEAPYIRADELRDRAKDERFEK